MTWYLPRPVDAGAVLLQEVDVELLRHELVMAAKDGRPYPLPAVVDGAAVVVEAWPHQDVGWDLVDVLPTATAVDPPVPEVW